MPPGTIDGNRPWQSSSKRKQSALGADNGNSSTPRPAKKHRASQACQSCRTRKVRCDVLTNGLPCTNCRLDSNECVVLASRRGKSGGHKRAAREKSPNSALVNGEDQSHARQPAVLPMPSAVTPSIGTGEVPVCVTFDDEDGNRSPSPTAPAAQDGRPTPEAWSLSEQQPDPPPGHQASPGTAKTLLPPFITPLRGSVSKEDLEFLVQKGALAIPESELRIEILRSFVFSVHPFMPVLEDVSKLVDDIVNERESGNISLLLFQAIMFAGLASLEVRVVHRLGFTSTKQAREVFFNRVRLLYDFDIETDDTATLQSLMLMSWWYGSWHQRKHTWHWTGLAHSVARTLGLHREPTARSGSVKTRHFRRRLWWSLYIRDRLLALGTRRPMRLRDDSFNVTMLTLEDFDLPAPGTKSPDSITEEDTRIALMCIELAKLCICIGHVLSSQYSTISEDSDVPHTMMIIPRREQDRTESERQTCDKEINDWLQGLAVNVRKNGAASSSTAAQSNPHSCSYIHWSVLNMLHLTLVNVLHRTQALKSASDSTEEQGTSQQASRSSVKDAARATTKLTHNMLRHDQARFLGVPGVTALVAACLSHVLDIRSADEDVRDASLLRFYQSMQVLQSLSTIYASADSALSFLASVIRKAGISVPAQVLMSPDPVPNLAASTSTKWHNASTTDQARRWTTSHSQADPLRPHWQTVNGGDTPHSKLPQTFRGQQEAAALPHDQGHRNNFNLTHSFPQSDTPFSPSSAPYLSPTTSGTKAHPLMDANFSTTNHDASIPYSAATTMTETMPNNLVAGGPFYDWTTWTNGSLDSGENFDPLAMNQDFCSDAFGLAFLDGPTHGL